jgi:hypothetical protein
MADDLTVPRGDKEPKEGKEPRAEEDPTAELAAQVAMNFEAALKAKESEALELTQVQPGIGADWEIFGFGPYQTPRAQPGRIIRVNQPAWIAVVVWMNPAMCTNVTGFGGKIELNFLTSDTQRMQPVNGLSHYCCIQTQLNKCWYLYVWQFRPTTAACIYETNICARICNCNDKPHPEYGGFVRQVYDFDTDHLWPRRGVPLPPPSHIPGGVWPPGGSVPPSWGSDRPIRYMVYDPDVDCDCKNHPCRGVISR